MSITKTPDQLIILTLGNSFLIFFEILSHLQVQGITASLVAVTSF